MACACNDKATSKDEPTSSYSHVHHSQSMDCCPLSSSVALFWLRDSERRFAQAQEKKGLSLVLKPLIQALVSFKKIISRLGLLFLGAASVILEQYESKISVAEERRSKPETSGQNQRGGWTSPSSSAVEVPHRLRICLPSIEGLELG